MKYNHDQTFAITRALVRRAWGPSQILQSSNGQAIVSSSDPSVLPTFYTRNTAQSSPVTQSLYDNHSLWRSRKFEKDDRKKVVIQQISALRNPSVSLVLAYMPARTAQSIKRLLGSQTHAMPSIITIIPCRPCCPSKEKETAAMLRDIMMPKRKM